jgi:signal-transduction protein with cAMP-binding, CBS, and nucleotidyltransferase domain
MTERDLLKRAVAEAKNVAETRVKDIMSTPLIAVSPGTELGEAVELMFQMNIKKLPVVCSNKHLAGLVTLTDVARIQPQMMKIVKQFSSKEAAARAMRKSINYYVSSARASHALDQTILDELIKISEKMGTIVQELIQTVIIPEWLKKREGNWRRVLHTASVSSKH